MPAPILTRRKSARVLLFLDLFCIVEEGDEEMGVSFDSLGGSLSLSVLASIVEET